MQRATYFIVVVAGAAVVVAAAAPARAAVLAISAETRTRVQEFVAGEPGTVNSDELTWSGQSDDLPLLSSALVITSPLVGTGGARAQAFAAFYDPLRVDQPNPEEFGLEIGAFANLADVRYAVLSESVERRTVRFASATAGEAAEIEFDADGTAEIESTVFLSGAVLIWALEEDADLSALQAELRAVVVQDDAEEPVFETSLLLTGDAAGGVDATTAGPVDARVGGLDLLTAELTAEEAEPVLASLADVGTVVVVLLLPQEHTYTFAVEADVSTVLSAEFSLDVASAPGGAGVAAVLGRPFDGLATFIEQALPDSDGAAVQKALNDAAQLSDTDDTSDAGTTRRGLCGIFGGETVAALLLLGLVRCRRLK